jgi:hypothetical protein
MDEAKRRNDRHCVRDVRQVARGIWWGGGICEDAEDDEMGCWNDVSNWWKIPEIKSTRKR